MRSPVIVIALDIQLKEVVKTFVYGLTHAGTLHCLANIALIASDFWIAARFPI